MITSLVVMMAAGRQAWASPVWVIQPSPNPGSSYSYLYAVGTGSSSDAWAAGLYKNRAGNCRTLLEHYNGDAWVVVSSPNPSSTQDYLYGFKLTSGSNAWAVGGYGDNRSSRTLILHYAGATWRQQVSPSPSPHLNVLVSVAAVSSSAAWAVGVRGHTNPFESCQQGGPQSIGASPINGPSVPGTDTLVEHYDGTRWRVQSSVNPGACEDFLFGVSAASSSDVWAAGVSSDDCATLETLVEHYDGTSWTRVSAPSPAGDDRLFSVSADDPSDVWTAGSISNDSGNYGLIERYNGTGWTTWKIKEGSGLALYGIKATSPTNVWSVGWYVPPSGSGYKIAILHFDGTHWSFQQVSGTPALSTLNGVAATGANNAFAVGGFGVGQGGFHTLVIHQGP